MIITPADRLSNVKEYYFSVKLEEIRKLNQQGLDILNLGLGDPDLPPSDQSIEALKSAADNRKNHTYQGYRGIPELRGAIQKWCEKIYGLDLNPEDEILPLIGSKEGIIHTSLAFLNPGDEVLVPNPGYPTYAAVADIAQAKKVYYDLEENSNWEVDIEKLKKLDLSRVKIMWINYPNMPTGSKGSPTFFTKLVELAKEKQFLIVSDNPYALILNDDPQSILNIPGAKDVAIEFNSCSKSHNLAGWRMGWIMGKKEYIDTILKIKSNVDSGMFKPIQIGTIEAFNNSEEWYSELNREYRQRQEIVKSMFDLLKCTYSPTQVGLFIWAKVPDSVSDVEKWVDDIMLGARVFIAPGFIFGSNGNRYLRMSLCNNIQVLNEAKARIQDFIKK